MLVRIDANEGKGRAYVLEVGFFVDKVANVSHNRGLTEQTCMANCKNWNHNGGCPPFAPKFDQISKNCEDILIWYVKLPYEQLPVNIRTEHNIGGFFVSSFAQAFLPPVVKRLAVPLKELWKPDHYLAESCCKTCGQGKCAFKEEGCTTCRVPSHRTFSLESTGVLVGDLTERHGLPLHWYKSKQDIAEVPYTCKVCGFLFKKLPEHDFESDILKLIESTKYYSLVERKAISKKPRMPYMPTV